MHAKLERLLSKSLTTLEVMAYDLVVHTGPGQVSIKVLVRSVTTSTRTSVSCVFYLTGTYLNNVNVSPNGVDLPSVQPMTTSASPSSSPPPTAGKDWLIQRSCIEVLGELIDWSQSFVILVAT